MDAIVRCAAGAGAVPDRHRNHVAAGPQGLPDPFDGISLRQNADGGIAPWP